MKPSPIFRYLSVAGVVLTGGIAHVHADSLVAVTLSNGDIDEYYVAKGSFNASATWTRVRTIANVPDAFGITYNPADGNFYVTAAGTSNKIWQVTRAGVKTTLATRGVSTPNWTLANPQGIEVGPDGKLYFSTAFGTGNGNGVFSLTTAGGSFSTFIAQAATPYSLNNARDLQWSGGDLYVSARNANAVYRFNSSGTYVSTLTTALTGASGLNVDGTTMLVTTNVAAPNSLKKIDNFATAPVVGTLTATGKTNGLEIGLIEGQRHYLTFNQGTGTAGDINRLNPDGSSTAVVTFNTPTVKQANDFVVYPDVDADLAGMPDGLPDGWELAKLGTLAQGPSDDFDSDGLTNLQEYNLGTNPALADTDGDGVSDADEVNRMVGGTAKPTNPTLADTDGDGIPDGAETNTGTYVSAANTGTDPLLADTDGDTFPDYVEIARGSNPLLNTSTPGAAATAPLVDLSAAALAAGPLSSWVNTGTLGAAFAAGATPPTVTTISGVKGVTFTGTEYMTGVAAPPVLTGNNSRSMSAWIYNPTAVAEEPFLAWGRRGGPDRTNSVFGHGTDASFGAVGQWGPDADMGYGGAANVKTGRWTYVAYTYDGTTKTGTVFVDGVQVNQETFTAVLNTWAVDTSPFARPLPFRLGTSNAPDGSVAPDGGNATLTLARVKVYDHPASNAELGLVDTDGDGMPDWYETFYGLNINVNDANISSDSDTLTNLQEYNLGTNPISSDTDGDGLRDDYETLTGNYNGPTDTGTSPVLADTDGDGLADNVERNTHVFVSASDTGTDPNLSDSDFDGISDGLEVLTYQTNPNADADKDGDTLSDGDEVVLYHTNPSLKDTDGDGFDDNVEVTAGSDPNDPISTPSNIAGYGGTLVHRYKLDETSGTVALDSAGTENGTIGTEVILGQPGRDGTAIKIPSPVTANSKVLLPKAVIPAGSAPFTMTAWVKLVGALPNGLQSHILSTNDGSVGRWNLGIYDSDATAGVSANLFWFHNGGVAQTTYTGFNFNDHLNEWVHVAVTRSSSGLTAIYINGVGMELGTSKATLYAPTVGVGIGSRPATVQDGVNGLIDDVRIYNGGLSPADELALFNSYVTAYDNWATSYGLDPNGNGAPGADADNDGTANQAEFLLGLIPNNGSSRFAATVTGTPATGITLTWPSQPGLTFTVTSSLTLNGFPTVEAAALPAAGSPATITSWTSGPLAEPRKFYRVELSY